MFQKIKKLYKLIHNPYFSDFVIKISFNIKFTLSAHQISAKSYQLLRHDSLKTIN